MKSLIFLAIIFPVLMLTIVPNVYAGGARNDWPDAYKEIEGTAECWRNGYDDGLDHPFDQDRHKECIFDVGGTDTNIDKPYYHAFKIGCQDAGNTEEICETFTDE
jgi:hypothetical protein